MKRKQLQSFDETAIREQLQRGDTSAIARLFEAFYEALSGYATKFVTQEVAEDIVQDVFVDLHNKCRQLEIRQTLKAYLFRAVHNRCVDTLRHSLVQKRYIDQALAELSLQELNYFDPEKGNASLLMNDDIQSVFQAIEQLPPRCREVLQLKYQNGLGTQEIATLLNISTRTVETQLYKSIKKVRGRVRKLSYLFSLIACVFALMNIYNK